MSNPKRVAAVDLGSNSFHMIVVRLVQGEPVIFDRIRDQVQLAAGLSEMGSLSVEAQDRALACLERFAQRLSNETDLAVRAVGTSTLRRASNSSDFLARAKSALGQEIEIIEGNEEARMIYLGVAHSQPLVGSRRLVVDIGGGSTECIIGDGFEIIKASSHTMGCVSWTKRFFDDGKKLTRKNMKKAVLAARLELAPIERAFHQAGWRDAVGASGTIKAAVNVVEANGWGDALNRDSLAKIVSAILEAGKYQNLDLKGLKSERASVFAGGIAILKALFEGIGIRSMSVSTGALREGLIYDLLGRIRHEDVRERTITSFQERFHIDAKQAERVERTALAAHHQVKDKWNLSTDHESTFLGWAARLHEMGLAISYRQHHKHAAYLIANANMAGFSRNDQQLLAALVGGQRRRLDTKWLNELDPSLQTRAARMRVLLRLAVLIERARDPEQSLPIRLEVAEESLLRLKVDQEELDKFPLTAADLEEEVKILKGSEVELELEIEDFR